MSQRGSFGSKAHRQDATPVMSDDHSLLFVALSLGIHAILGTQSDDKLGQLLQHVSRGIFVETVGSSISWQVNRNDRHGLLQSRVLDNVSPNSPTVGESMDEYDQWLLRTNCFRGVGSIIAQEMKLEPALQGQEVVGKAFKVLGEIPQAVASWFVSEVFTQSETV